jgi:2-C-methyl-D-erythritol 4-phosphate cytidylyltransferase
VPKAFCTVAGRTLLEHAVARFREHPDVRDVVVVAPPTHVDAARALVGDASAVAGGATRQASVACGLAALAPDIDVVLVHDVARPFVPAEVITRVLAALARGAQAVIPVLPIADTIKRVDPAGAILATLDRAELRSVQTPQGFVRSVLVAAHAVSPAAGATDDAALVELSGVVVRVVDGADESFKITRPWDLLLAQAVAS